MDTCDINDLVECIKSITSGTSSINGVLISWGYPNPYEPNFETIIIDTLIEEVYGLELIDDALFKLDNCVFSMYWNIDARACWTEITFTVFERYDTNKQPAIYKNRWFADE